jgi:signal transduction histidine kinase
MATFRTRARTLDMLGHQQVASIPTAVSELFKNAHDAYAKHAEVDYIRSHSLFVLRDEGIGMTEEEFQGRWLVLGTDNKLEPDSPPDGRESRPIMGEKGIGRLSIATIGPQVLVLTRAKRAGQLHDLVAAFINWRIFSLPKLDLDQIEIPVHTFSGRRYLGQGDVAALVQEAKNNVLRLQSSLRPEDMASLLLEMDSFQVDPALLDSFLPPLGSAASLANGGTGTYFFVSPVDEMLDIDLAESEETTSPFKKTLIGFGNTMLAEAPPPRLRTAFRDHLGPDNVVDLIDPEREFFTPANFDDADHTIIGSFDSSGTFRGTVRIYEKEIEYVLPPPAKYNGKIACGKFSFAFAYLQGDIKDSLLYQKNPEEFGRLNKRLRSVGGIYVYRDGIRILPYGRSDYDFLDIEERRSKKASYYFFSYRRIFGAITVTREENRGLQEKAGREGFKENKAYRTLKDLCINLLVNVVFEFFREEGPRAEIWSTKRAELVRNELLRRQREQSVRSKRSAFGQELEIRLDQIERGEPQNEAEALLKDATERMKLATSVRPAEQAARAVVAAEGVIRQRLKELREKYHIAKPRGMALNKKAAEDWEAYLLSAQELDLKVYKPFAERLETIISSASQVTQIAVDRRKRAEEALASEIKNARKLMQRELQETTSAADVIADQVSRMTREIKGEIEHLIARSLEQLASMNLSQLTDEQFVQARDEIEQRLAVTAEVQRERLLRVRETLVAAMQNLSPGTAVPGPELVEALEEELIALRDRMEADLALTQLGMAIEIINHEFGAAIRSVRTGLRQLKAWADKNPNLRPLHESLRTSFDRLEGYLALFTPLHRRLYPLKVTIKGADIHTYVRDLFRERTDRHRCTIEATPAFTKIQVEGYPSTFYSVFINLVDNALYWVAEQREEGRVVLDADGTALLVSDTGPGVPKRDRDKIFERGFTRKRDGRGLGLYISKEVLRRAGYRISLDEPQLGGATFRIEPDAGKPLDPEMKNS